MLEPGCIRYHFSLQSGASPLEAIEHRSGDLQICLGLFLLPCFLRSVGRARAAPPPPLDKATSVLDASQAAFTTLQSCFGKYPAVRSPSHKLTFPVHQSQPYRKILSAPRTNVCLFHCVHTPVVSCMAKWTHVCFVSAHSAFPGLWSILVGKLPCAMKPRGAPVLLLHSANWQGQAPGSALLPDSLNRIIES